MIEKERIEQIKTTIDIKALIESKGIRLKKTAKDILACAPSIMIKILHYP